LSADGNWQAGPIGVGVGAFAAFTIVNVGDGEKRHARVEYQAWVNAGPFHPPGKRGVLDFEKGAACIGVARIAAAVADAAYSKLAGVDVSALASSLLKGIATDLLPK
jgi:hypothetical protein